MDILWGGWGGFGHQGFYLPVIIQQDSESSIECKWKGWIKLLTTTLKSRGQEIGIWGQILIQIKNDSVKVITTISARVSMRIWYYYLSSQNPPV